MPWGYISHSHADPSQKVILPLLCEGTGASSPPVYVAKCWNGYSRFRGVTSGGKKQRKKLWHRIMKCNVRDAFFAQHWCLEAVHTVLEGRVVGEGDGWELCGEWAAVW